MRIDDDGESCQSVSIASLEIGTGAKPQGDMQMLSRRIDRQQRFASNTATFSLRTPTGRASTPPGAELSGSGCPWSSEDVFTPSALNGVRSPQSRSPAAIRTLKGLVGALACLLLAPVAIIAVSCDAIARRRAEAQGVADPST